MWTWIKSKMGGEQSSPASKSVTGGLKTQRDEDIPYTNYSITKPIDSDSIKDSPILGTRNKNQSTKEREKEVAVTNQQLTSKQQIVVVKEAAANKLEPEPELQKLESIPIFLPILKGSLNVPGMKDSDSIDKLDHYRLLVMCVRYQEHLKQCAEAVSFDQNALCIRIKEIDFAIRMLMNMVMEKQKKYAKFAEQMQRISDMSSSLRKSQRLLDELVPALDHLNSLLPPEEQLEPLRLSPSKVIN